jgi:methylamine---corrinoid protein Co-methyltransferase
LGNTHSISYQRLLETLDKAENGPVVDEKDWDLKTITATVRRLIDEFDIRWDRSEGFPTDEALADRLFAAGMKMAEQVGLYCIDTRRQMRWSEAELLESLAAAPNRITAGLGADTVVINKRRPGGAERVAVWGGAFGVPVAEELFQTILEAYAREPLIDILDNTTLLSTHGRPIRAGSPWEAVGAWQEAQQTLEVIEKVGRPGLPLGCVDISTTEIGDLAGTTYGGYRPTDVHKLSFISEQKTAYHHLTKAVHFAHTKSLTEVYCNPMYGGFLGDDFGVAIGTVAGLILLNACYQGDIINAGPTHINIAASTHPGIIRVMGAAFQAVSRNSHLLLDSHTRPTSGPGTIDIFREVAASIVAVVASGASVVNCVQSAKGNNIGHATPLEVRFAAQVAHAAEGLSPADAEPIVASLVAKIQDVLKAENIGERFVDLYNLDTLEPNSDWLKLYEEALTEMSVEYGLILA